MDGMVMAARAARGIDPAQVRDQKADKLRMRFSAAKPSSPAFDFELRFAPAPCVFCLSRLFLSRLNCQPVSTDSNVLLSFGSLLQSLPFIPTLFLAHPPSCPPTPPVSTSTNSRPPLLPGRSGPSAIPGPDSTDSQCIALVEPESSY